MSQDIWWGLKTNSLNTWNYQKTNRDHAYGSAFWPSVKCCSQGQALFHQHEFYLDLEGWEWSKGRKGWKHYMPRAFKMWILFTFYSLLSRNSYSMIYQTQEVHFLVYTFQKHPGLDARMKKTAQTDLPGCSLYSCSINTYWCLLPSVILTNEDSGMRAQPSSHQMGDLGHILYPPALSFLYVKMRIVKWSSKSAVRESWEPGT